MLDQIITLTFSLFKLHCNANISAEVESVTVTATNKGTPNLCWENLVRTRHRRDIQQGQEFAGIFSEDNELPDVDTGSIIGN